MVYYWSLINIDEWTERLEHLHRRIDTYKFSIVYRFYSTSYGPVKYVGRSDNPFNRAHNHLNKLEPYSMHNRLEIQVAYVDFCYFTGAWRKSHSYQEECRQYHKYYNTIANSNHPAKPIDRPIKCPICGR